MAGKRQHYLPQFLLSGFASKAVKEETYCWVYSSSGNTFEPNTKNIGVQGYFYGHPEKEVTDSIVTDTEKPFVPFVCQLRECELDQRVDPKQAAEFAVHLAIRGRNVREDVSTAAERLLQGFSEQTSDPNALRALIIRYYRENPQFTEEKFRELLRQGGRQLSRREYLKTFAQYKALLPTMIKSLPDDEIRKVHSTLDVLASHMRPSLEKGHNAAIAKKPVPPKRVAALKNLEWSLLGYPANSLILGDSIGYTFGSESLGPCPLIYSTKKVRAVVFPISHERLILGADPEWHYSPEPGEVNEYSAAVSRDYFVSSVKADDRQELARLIGSIRPTEFDSAVESALQNT